MATWVQICPSVRPGGSPSSGGRQSRKGWVKTPPWVGSTGVSSSAQTGLGVKVPLTKTSHAVTAGGQPLGSSPLMTRV
jgi:hypothetical protein